MHDHVIRMTALVLACGLGALTFAAPDPPNSSTFKSKRYLVTTDLDRREAQQTLRHMDAVFDEYSRRLSAFPVRNAMPVRLYLFQTQADYNTYLGSIGINAANTAGIFWSQYEGGLASWTEGQDSASMFHTLQHEGFHQFARLRIGTDLPQWANEGLAEYFGIGLLVRNRFLLGLKPSGKLNRVIEAIENDQHLPFRELLTMSNKEWNRRVNSGHPSAGLMYDQSWAIVHFLVHADRGRYAKPFEVFLQSITQGMTPEQAFEKAFQTTDFTAFEKIWKQFMLAQKPDPLSTAVERAQFLSAGLLSAHTLDMPVDSIEALRSSLSKIEFQWFISSHGTMRIVSTEDESLFAAPDPERRGRQSAIKLIPSDDPSLPPEILYTGLKAKVRVTWKLGTEGTPVSELSIN